MILLWLIWLLLIQSKSLSLDIIQTDPLLKSSGNSPLSYHVIVSNYSTGDPPPDVIAFGEHREAQGLLVQLNSSCNSLSLPLAREQALGVGIIVLWETSPDCPLEDQFNRLFEFTQVNGVLLHGPIPITERLIDFYLPIMYLSPTQTMHLLALMDQTVNMTHIFLQNSTHQTTVALDNTNPWDSSRYAVYVSMKTDYSSLEVEIWRFSLSIMAVVLCVAFILSILTNYYFYESRRISQIEAFQAQMLRQMEDGSFNGNNVFPNQRQSPLSQQDLDPFPVYPYKTAKAKHRKLKKQKVFKEQLLDESEHSYKPTTSLHKKLSLLSLYSLKSNCSSKSLQMDLCSVCLDEFDDNDMVRELSCLHLFHTMCIDKWLTTVSPTCPLCKKEFISTTVPSAGEQSGIT